MFQVMPSKNPLARVNDFFITWDSLGMMTDLAEVECPADIFEQLLLLSYTRLGLAHLWGKRSMLRHAGPFCLRSPNLSPYFLWSYSIHASVSNPR